MATGLFSKVKGAKKPEATKKAKGSTWVAGDPGSDAVSNSVAELVRLEAELKATSAKMEIHKGIVKKYAEERYIRAYADGCAPPESPMCVVNQDGQKVTYVVQDRSGQYAVREEQQAALSNLVGEDAATDLLYEEVSFGFNRDILAIPGVQDVVEKALESAIKKLTSGPKPILTEDQANSLLDVEQKVSFRPGTLNRLTTVVGRDTTRIRSFLDIMGSCAVRYVKT